MARAVVFLLPLLAACGEQAKPATNSPPDATYVLRGEIVQLPQPGGHEVLIRHEAVPELRDAQGKVVGMAAMTMPFALGADVDRSRLAVGERISFTLEVRWNSSTPVTVTNAVPLPPGTRLGFDPAEESAPAEPQPFGSAAPEGAEAVTPR